MNKNKKDRNEEESQKNHNMEDKDNSTEKNKVNEDLEDDTPEDEQNILYDNEEFVIEMEKDFRKEISIDKEAEASSDEELYLRMKRRIIKSFRWQEDIIIPLSRELKIIPEELEEILMKRLDMSSLEALQPRFESSKFRCTKERIHSDLKLCWLSDVMNLLTLEEAEEIKNSIASKIVTENESYEKALEEGRKELVEYLKR